MATRKQRKDGEVQDEESSGSPNEIELKQAILTSLLRKLAYFNRETAGILESNSSEKVNRQRSLVKTKIDKAHNLIHVVQGLKIDNEENEEQIDEWATGKRDQLLVHEAAVEALDAKMTEEEKRRKDELLEEKIKEEAEIRKRFRQEEERAEIAKRERDEHFALCLEEKKLQITDKKRTQTKLPELQMSKFQGPILTGSGSGVCLKHKLIKRQCKT